MSKLFFWAIGVAIVGTIIYGFAVRGIDFASITANNINADIDEALLTATVDVNEFGGGIVALEDGRASFQTEAGSARGSVVLGEPRGIVVKGPDADVLALVSLSGGGTGVFQYLVHFAYEGATGRATEVEKVLLGDRVQVDDIRIEIIAPTEYQVLVSIKDRKPADAMAAIPTEPRVLHFSRTASGLKLSALTFGTLEDHDVILFGPFPNQEIETSFDIAGAARGNWYFEGSFPIRLTTLAGEELAIAVAEAQGEWMTDELVPFTTRMIAPATAKGLHLLVVQKDNPSGLPEHDKSYAIPVILQ